MILVMSLLGCIGGSFDDEDPGAPVLVALNGLQVDGREPYLFLTLTAGVGSVIDIEIEAVDPDGDPWRVWVADAPPGFELDPDTGLGLWRVRVGTPPETYSTIWLQDVPAQGDPSWSAVSMAFVVPE